MQVAELVKLSIKFATEGWHVAASARRENLLQDLSNNNFNIHSFPLDVKDESKAKKVFDKIIKKFKTINVCVFSTGIHDPQSERKINTEKIREIMEVNFFGTLNCISTVNNYLMFQLINCALSFINKSRIL